MSKPRRVAFDWSTLVIALLVGTAALIVYARHGTARVAEIFRHDVALFIDMLPKVLAGCLIGAFVTLLLPREVVTRWVGTESGMTGIAVATVAGAILPGGPFTIFPVAGAFVAVGADIGAIAAFITSWSLLGYARALIWELPFFGLDFVGWRIFLALPLPVVAGLLARAVVRRGRLTPS